MSCRSRWRPAWDGLALSDPLPALMRLERPLNGGKSTSRSGASRRSSFPSSFERKEALDESLEVM